MELSEPEPALPFGSAPVEAVVLPDLSPLGLPSHEEALLRLVLVGGGTTTGQAAAALGVSGAQVSRAAAGLRDRGLLLAGLSRSVGLRLAPLDRALDALLAHRRDRAQDALAALEETRRALLAVARWSPPAVCPHDVVPRDVREWAREQELQRARERVDVVVDRHHVNCHVPWNLLTLQRPLRPLVVRLLVTGADDDRPTVVLPRATDATAAASGIAVRRLAHRCAAFTLYDDERLEVPLWRLQASGWSREPGEVWAAVWLFQTLWEEAVPLTATGLHGRPHLPPPIWPEPSPRPALDIGSAP